MTKQTYGKYKKEQIKLAQSQTNKGYKKVIKKIYKKSSESAKKTLSGVSEAYKPTKKLSRSLLNIGAGFTGQRVTSGQKKVKEGPGRPRAVFKHKDPQTGQPIPATVYYKRVKELRRQAQQKAQQVDYQQTQALAKRGIPPEQAQQIVNQRQLQSVGVQSQFQQNIPDAVRRQLAMQQIQQQNQQIQRQIPGSYPSQAVRPIWRRNPVEGVETDMMGNKRIIVRNIPQSFWN